MKRFAWFVFLLAPVLSGCVTETVGAPQMDATRLRDLAKARVALARKLSVIMHSIWRSGEPFRWSERPTAA